MKFFLGFLTGLFTAIIALFAWGWFVGSKMAEDVQNRAPVLKLQERSQLKDYNFNLKNLRSDSVFNVSAFAGKVLFLNFWEHWCAPCRIEMPSIQKLFQQVNDSNIVFAIISKEKPEIVVKDKALRETSLPFYHLTGQVPPELDGETVPRTVIIGKSGDILIKETGMANWYDRKVINLIDSLKTIK